MALIKAQATRIVKGINGWEARDVYKIDENLQLHILTMKRSNGMLITTANVMLLEGDFVSHRVFTDFSERVAINNVRVTEKAVRTQHESVDAAAVMQRAIMHYDKKKEVTA